MVKTELKITGMSHRDLEAAVIEAGLLIKKKAHVVDGETIMSVLGANVNNLAGFKAGEVRHARSGLTLVINPKMIPPSSLTSLLNAAR